MNFFTRKGRALLIIAAVLAVGAAVWMAGWFFCAVCEGLNLWAAGVSLPPSILHRNGRPRVVAPISY
jgi:hypothetical protein